MKITVIAVFCLALITLIACGDQNGAASDISPAVTSAAENAAEGLARFDITSTDLHDGVWDTIITNTDKGSNVSPQLSWEPVEGAKSYVVYMVDTSAGNWLHWKEGNITETTLAQGSASGSGYIGPYPPGGTHTYEVYVYAVKSYVDNIPGEFDAENPDFERFESLLDGTGGVVAYGHISGTYTKGD